MIKMTLIDNLSSCQKANSVATIKDKTNYCKELPSIEPSKSLMNTAMNNSTKETGAK